MGSEDVEGEEMVFILTTMTKEEGSMDAEEEDLIEIRQ